MADAYLVNGALYLLVPYINKYQTVQRSSAFFITRSTFASSAPSGAHRVSNDERQSETLRRAKRDLD